MHERIPGDYPQNIADFSHTVKLEDNSFNSNGAHSDLYTKLTLSSKKNTLEICFKCACERKETAFAMNVKRLKDTKTKKKNQEKKRLELSKSLVLLVYLCHGVSK